MAATESQKLSGSIALSFATLRTERLVLRPLRADDAGAMHIAMSDVQLMTWWSSAPHKTLQETADYVAINADPKRYMTWAITLDNDEALGWVVMIDRREKVSEIGYILRRSHWGKGIAREAVSCVIEHGWDALGLRKIIADTDPDNEASNKLLKDMGFEKEGYLRSEWETHLGVRDSILWGLLKAEYKRA